MVAGKSLAPGLFGLKGTKSVMSDLRSTPLPLLARQPQISRKGIIGTSFIPPWSHQEKRQHFYALALYENMDALSLGIRPVPTRPKNNEYVVFLRYIEDVKSARHLGERIVVSQYSPECAHLVYCRLSGFTDFRAHFSTLERF